MAFIKKNITPQSTNFADWYQDVVREADLAESSEVRGCGIVKPYGYKIWELIQRELAQKIEATGAQNVYFPLFVPLENLEAEKKHVEGFAPELAIVTHGGGKELTNKLAIRPTSETAMYKTYAKWINSYQDLPLRLNQWCNAVRWERRPRPFLRWSEFLWQEGHSVFSNEADALAEVAQMLNVYKDMYAYMAIPVFEGRKSEMEKFAGGDMTFSVEVMVKDGKALQGATSHYLGTNFAKVFNVKFLGADNQEHFCYQTCWGFSWRSIGAVIMAHGDDAGLRLPPNIAPIQIVIVPIIKEAQKEKILNFAHQLKEKLSTFRIHIDDRLDVTPGFKFNHWEIKGVPLRIEIGEKEVDQQTITLFRRDMNTKTKITVQKGWETSIQQMINDIQHNLYQQALEFARTHIHRIESMDEIKDQVGFFEASWCETIESEQLLKEKFSMVSRVLPKMYENTAPKNKKCFITGAEAKHDWFFAKSY
jgi:prolyl-tRNA synthetase